MIAEYKFYHGAVLAELINLKTGPLSIDELNEGGRLSSYVLDGKVALQIKLCTHRLHPWQFTFTKANLTELQSLHQNYSAVFAVLVCWTDGFVALTLEEVTEVLAKGDTEQAWIRVDRRKNEWYSVNSGAAELEGKRPHGVLKIIQALEAKRYA